MDDNPKRPRDTISLLAAIGAPVYVIFRLATGGWTFFTVLLCVFLAVSAFYWLFVVTPMRTRDQDEQSDPIVNPPASTSEAPVESN
jgi:hypothetical protein